MLFSNPIVNSVSIISISYLFGKCIEHYTTHEMHCNQLQTIEKIELNRIEKDKLANNDYSIKLDLVDSKKK